MPAAKSKTASAPPASKPAKPTPAASTGASTPVHEEPSDTATGGSSGRPDKALYDKEQDGIKAEIDALQLKLNAVRDKISLTQKSGPGNDRRNQLKAELDTIRGSQANSKTSRSKTFEQLQALQANTQKKIQELNAAKAKIPFKTVADIDAHIQHLDKQIESGNMKLADEKRALQEVSTAKRNRRIVEQFQKDQGTIDAERAAQDEIRKQLDDPESKAINDRYDAIKKELDKLKAEGDAAYEGRSKLFEERDGYQAQLNVLWNRKRESAQTFRDANDRFYVKLNEDRARRAERARHERAAQEAEKKQEIAERLREEASAPAFQAEIEDCQTLIDSLSGKMGNTVPTYNSSNKLPERADVAGVPKLELRKVEDTPDGVVVRKKKGGDDDEAYFAVKGKGKGKKPVAKDPTEGSLNMPLATLSALLALSIPPPANNADIPRVIEDLKTKKVWYEANQKRQTTENISKAEAEIQRITKGDGKGAAPDEGLIPPNGGGEKPAEPAPTPVASDNLATAVSSGEVVEKLEEVQEDIKE